jgi:hypothetical protein
MFFETAGIEVAIWIPPLVAFVISFFYIHEWFIGCISVTSFSDVISKFY